MVLRERLFNVVVTGVGVGHVSLSSTIATATISIN